MSVTIKSEHEIELMREAGRILAAVHQQLGKEIKPGMSTKDVDRLGEEMIRSYGCEPSFLGYCGYPASICVSVNEEVVHGIPTDERILQEGDIVSLDAGVIYKGYHSDAARTYGIGEIDDDAKKLIEVTRQSFFEGIKFAKAGNHLNDISAAIQKYAESFGARGKLVGKADDLAMLLKEALDYDGITVIACPVDYSVNLQLSETLETVKSA